ncbi:MAG TPA: glycosyltransferase [Rhodanobacteraceae bacterium]|nr:glycosyltransferase [Rhodanobacteraceae bacterium]
MNAPSPLISVALCTYNGERWLREQLDSVLAQDDATIEVVALDDRSSDGSVALLREYAARDPRVRVFGNDANLGPARSFERAMTLCRGAFIAPCDQDDVWEPEKLARLLQAIGAADLAYCDSRYIDEHGRFSGGDVSDHLSMMSGREPLQFLFANSVSGHAALLRRGVFERARPFPAGVFHDWWLALCAAAGEGVVYLDAPLVRFRRHGAAFSTLGHGQKTRDPSRQRLWLEVRRNLMVAHARTTLRGHERAQALLDAFDLARDQRRHLPLLRELWRVRAAAPPAGGNAMLNGVRQQVRFLRKLRRARGEPPLEPRRLSF